MQNRNNITRLSMLFASLTLSLTLLSSATAAPTSVEQSTPLFSPMPSYAVEAGKVQDFATYGSGSFDCGPAKCTSKVPGFNDQGQLTAEGKVSAYRYETKGSGSALAIERNYDNAVKALGGRKLTSRDGPNGEHVYLVEKGGRRIWAVLEIYNDTAYHLTYIEEKPMPQLVTANTAGPGQPLFSAMPSYTVEKGKVQDFGTYGGSAFNCGPAKCDAKVPGFNAEGKLVAEGRVSRFTYTTKGNGSAMAVERNYHNAVKALGGRKLTSQDNVYSDHAYLVEKGGQRIWIVLEDYTDRQYNLVYIEEKPMVQGVTANQLANAIGKKGYATVHINFDNNSAAIKSESAPTVKEIAALLAADKTLRLSIEGHTDNVGNAAANKTLSKARAESVVNSLVVAKVDTKRLAAKGFGSEVPVAD
ncbi:MAG: OmpA family protein, partial [Janthinobacterium lividum]